MLAIENTSPIPTTYSGFEAPATEIARDRPSFDFEVTKLMPIEMLPADFVPTKRVELPQSLRDEYRSSGLATNTSRGMDVDFEQATLAHGSSEFLVDIDVSAFDLPPQPKESVNKVPNERWSLAWHVLFMVGLMAVCLVLGYKIGMHLLTHYSTEMLALLP